MISTFTAVIDANVFYSARLRSLFLYQALGGGFRARWTNQINEEWVEALLEKRPTLDRSRIQRTVHAMNGAILDCLVTGYEELITSVELPDPDDRHVVAAAITADASVIVTFNLSDFPEGSIAKFGIHTKNPDEFLLDLAGISPNDFVEAAKKDFSHYVEPQLAFGDYLESLRRAGVPKTAEYLAKVEVLIT